MSLSHPKILKFLLNYQREILLYCMHVKLLSHVQLFAIPGALAHQAALSMELPGKNTGVGCHFLLHKTLDRYIQTPTNCFLPDVSKGFHNQNVQTRIHDFPMQFSWTADSFYSLMGIIMVTKSYMLSTVGHH